MFFRRCAFLIFADEGVGFPIADVRFLVKDGGWVFYADKVGYFAPGSWITDLAASYYILRFEMVVSAVLRFLNLQKPPICFINENHFYSNNKVM